MYIQNIEILLIGMAISMLTMMLFIFLGSFILTCFEIPGQSRIPQVEWRVDKKNVKDLAYQYRRYSFEIYNLSRRQWRTDNE